MAEEGGHGGRRLGGTAQVRGWLVEGLRRRQQDLVVVVVVVHLSF